MNNLFSDILNKQKTIIVDGALGTQMQKDGHDINDSLWSAKFLDKNPEAIKNIHKEYLLSGADCLITSSYQASIEGFLNKGFDKKRAISLIKLSIQIAKEVRDDFWEKQENQIKRIKPLIAASIGPFGAYLADGSEYTGNYDITNTELKNFHEQRLNLIMEESPDIIACETIPCLNEAKILAELLKKYKETPSWISFSARNDSLLNSGEDIIEAIKYLNEQNHIDAIGINCTSPQYILSLIEKIKKHSNKHIVVYPNAGLKYNPITKNWEECDSNPEEFAKLALLWKSKGADIIGGCCQTGPEDIKYLRDYLL